MKKIVLLVCMIGAALFFMAQTDFSVSEIFPNSGHLISGNTIMENLANEELEYDKSTVKGVGVQAGDYLYERGGDLYVGESRKVKINPIYPMYINNGAGIRMMSANLKLIDTEYNQVEGYQGLQLNDGVAYNKENERADWNEYLFMLMPNGLLINSTPLTITTFRDEVILGQNTIFYMEEDVIRYYSYRNGEFFYARVPGIDPTTLITINNETTTYYEFLKKLGVVRLKGAQEEKKKKEEEQKQEEQKQEEQKQEEQPQEQKQEQGLLGELGQLMNPGELLPLSENEMLIPDKENNPQIDKKDEKKEIKGATGEKKKREKKTNKKEPSGKIPKPAEPPSQPTAPPPSSAEPPKASTVVLPDEAPKPPKKKPGGTPGAILIPNWELPKVTSLSIDNGVYTFTNKIDVEDPAGVIVGGLIYEVYKDGRLFKRYASNVVGKGKEAIVPGLPPNTTLKVVGYFRYKDMYGKTTADKIEFLPETTFTTKPLSALGPIYFDDFEIDPTISYPDAIMVPNVKFTEASNKDAVAAVIYISLTLNKDDPNTKTAARLSEGEMKKIQSMESISYRMITGVKPSTNYTGTFYCYDQFNNWLALANNEFTASTCKAPPKASVKVDNKPTATTLTVNLTNTGSVSYSGIYLKLTKPNGEVYPVSGVEKLPVTPGVGIVLSGLPTSQTFTVEVFCHCDIEDGQGARDIRIGNANFSTTSLAKAGPVYLSTKVGDLTSTGASVWMQLNEGKTNPVLPDALEWISLTFDATPVPSKPGEKPLTVKGVKSFTFEGASLAAILAPSPTGTGLTLTPEMLGLLDSNTVYNMVFEARASSGSGADKEVHHPAVIAGTKMFTTPPLKPRVILKDQMAMGNFIQFSIAIEDLDNLIIGDEVYVEVINKTTGVKMGTFRFPNAETYTDIKLTNNSAESTGGIAYNIEEKTEYEFIVKADEFRSRTQIENNYHFDTFKIKTDQGMAGKLSLRGLFTDASTLTGYMKSRINVALVDPFGWRSGTKTVSGTSISTNVYIEVRQGPDPGVLVDTILARFTSEGALDVVYSTTSGILTTTGDGINFTIEYNVVANSNYTVDLRYTQTKDASPPVDVGMSRISFKTDKVIRTISTAAELRRINNSDLYNGNPRPTDSFDRYVVINDIEYDQAKDGGRIGFFYGDVDFQGYKLTYTGTHSLFYILKKGSSITNVVFESKPPRNVTTEGGNLVCYNYGIMENVSAIYNEIPWPDNLPKDAISYVEGGTTYNYPNYRSGLVTINARQGIIRNFVMKAMTPMRVNYYGGFVARENLGKIQNGYVYGNTPTGKAEININRSDPYAGGIVGINQQAGVIENVYALVDIKSPTGTKAAYVGSVVGLSYGNVRNGYGWGDNVSSNLAYGPANGVVSGIRESTELYYISNSNTNNLYNRSASLVGLRNKAWQDKVVNNGNMGAGFITSIVPDGFFPQIRYSSPYMPVQEFIPLPSLGASGGKLDFIMSELMTQEEVSSNPETSGQTIIDNKKYFVRLTLRNPDNFVLNGLSVKDNALVIKTYPATQYNDGNFTVIIAEVTLSPTAPQYFSEYDLTGVSYSLFKDGPGYNATLTSKKLQVEFWREIASDDFATWKLMNTYKNQNFKLFGDMHFINAPGAGASKFTSLRIGDGFTGKLDGQGHVLDFEDVRYYATGSTANGEIPSGYYRTDWSRGIFSQIVGPSVISNLIVKDYVNHSSSFEAGFIGLSEGGNVVNVHMVNPTVTAQGRTGSLIGSSNFGKVTNCSASGKVTIGSTIFKASDTAAPTDYSNTDGTAYGGLVGYANGGKITGCFVQGLDLTVNKGSRNDGVGGLIGGLGGEDIVITDCYTQGKILSAANKTGGLIGFTNRPITAAGGFYTDVTIEAYGDYVGGLIGYIQNNTEFADGRIGGVALGNIVSMNAGNDGSELYRTANAAKGLYYANWQTVDPYRPMSESKVNYGVEEEALTEAQLQSPSNFTTMGLSSAYDLSRSAEGVLPKLKGADGALLYGQKDLYLRGDIRLTGVTLNGGAAMPADPFNNTFSLTLVLQPRPGVILSQAPEISNVVVGDVHQSGSTFTYTLKLKDYVDAYVVEGVKYKLTDGKEYYQPIGYKLDISPKYRDIGSIGDWKTYVVDGTPLQNFRVTNTLDFSGASTAQIGLNLVVNNLVGPGGGSKATIKNIDITELWRRHHGILGLVAGDTSGLRWENISFTIKNNNKIPGTNPSTIYKSSVDAGLGIYHQVVGKVSDMEFRDIKLKGNGNSFTGCIAIADGGAENIEASNLNLSQFIQVANEHNSTHFTGLMALVSGDVKNVSVSAINLSGGIYVGGVIGHFIGNYNNTVKDVTATAVRIESLVNSSTGCHGGIIGSVGVQGLTTAPAIENLFVSDISIYGGGHYVGGVMGSTGHSRTWNIHGENIRIVQEPGSTGIYYGGLFGARSPSWDDLYSGPSYERAKNLSCKNSTIESNDSYVGGISGSDSKHIRSVLVENCKIKGNSYVGGLAGSGNYGAGDISIKNCVITATGTRAGGVYGTGSDITGMPAPNLQGKQALVENCYITATEYAGGICGNVDSSITHCIVDGCTIKANKFAGGIAGNAINWTNRNFVTGCEIGPRDASYTEFGNMGGIVGLSGSAGTTGCQYNVVENSVIGRNDCTSVGGIAGTLQGSSNPAAVNGIGLGSASYDCTVSGIRYVGGLYGYGENINYIQSGYTNNTVIAGGGDVGGIAGKLVFKDIANMPILRYLSFTGSVVGNNNVGGIVGTLENKGAGIVPAPARRPVALMVGGDISAVNIGSAGAYVGNGIGFDPWTSAQANAAQLSIWDQTRLCQVIAVGLPGPGNLVGTPYLGTNIPGVAATPAIQHSSPWLNRFTTSEMVGQLTPTVIVSTLLGAKGGFQNIWSVDTTRTNARTATEGAFDVGLTMPFVKEGGTAIYYTVGDGVLCPMNNGYYKQKGVKIPGSNRAPINYKAVGAQIDETLNFLTPPSSDVKAYPVGAKQLNIEFGSDALVTSAISPAGITDPDNPGEGRFHVFVNNVMVVTDEAITQRVFTMTYEFKDKVKVVYRLPGKPAQTKEFLNTDLARKAMIYEGRWYYLDFSGKLNASSSTSLPEGVKNRIFLHIYKGEAIDEFGTVYSVKTGLSVGSLLWKLECMVASISEDISAFLTKEKADQPKVAAGALATETDLTPYTGSKTSPIASFNNSIPSNGVPSNPIFRSLITDTDLTPYMGSKVSSIPAFNNSRSVQTSATETDLTPYTGSKTSPIASFNKSASFGSGGTATDTNLKPYDATASLRVPLPAELETDAEPLFTFTYVLDGETYVIKTYGGYSVTSRLVDGVLTGEKDVRLYVRYNELVAIPETLSLMSDGLAIYKTGGNQYQVGLLESGRLIDMGDTHFVMPEGYNQYGIRNMTSNLESGGPNIILTYDDGSMVGFDMTDGSVFLTVGPTEKVSLLEFAGNFFSNLFNTQKTNLVNDYTQVTALQRVLEDTQLDIDDYLRAFEMENEGQSTLTEGQSTGTDGTAMGNGTGSTESGDPSKAVNGTGTEIGDTPFNGTGDKVGTGSGSSSSSGSSSDSIENAGGSSGGSYGSADSEEEALIKEKADQNKNAMGRKSYTPMYNPKTETYELYKTEDIIKGGDLPKSETEKVKEHADLAGFYASLAPKNNKSSDFAVNGILVYILITAAILVLLSIVYDKRKQVREYVARPGRRKKD